MFRRSQQSALSAVDVCRPTVSRGECELGDRYVAYVEENYISLSQEVLCRLVFFLCATMGHDHTLMMLS
jgi:hypothetical protein